MRAVVITEAGDPDVLKIKERPRPTPADHEVLIKVKAAGINRPDIAQRQGRYPAPKGAPQDIPGLEVSGTIEAVGRSVTSWQKGDDVCALIAGGGYAEYAIANAGSCLSKPPQFSYEEAAGMPETLFTVWHNVFNLGRLTKDEHLLIHGGSSGIGMTAIQLAKARGAEISVTVSTDEKGQFVLNLGADRYIRYTTEDFEAQLKNNGIDVILDMVGGDYFQKNINLLKPDGRLVYINAVKGAKVDLNIWDIMSKRLTITGSTLRNRSAQFKKQLRDDVQLAIQPIIDDGLYKTVIYKTFPLEQAAQAHALMESSRHMGKIILIV